MIMSSENGDSMRYMIRRRFYIPKSEINRFYGRQGDLNANDVLLPVDFIDDEE